MSHQLPPNSMHCKESFSRFVYPVDTHSSHASQDDHASWDEAGRLGCGDYCKGSKGFEHILGAHEACIRPFQPLYFTSLADLTVTRSSIVCSKVTIPYCR